jgi:hypothetical protein
MGEPVPAAHDEVVHDHLPGDDPHTHWFFHRFASAIGDTYRSIDPLVAQLITTPGVLPPENGAAT